MNAIIVALVAAVALAAAVVQAQSTRPDGLPKDGPPQGGPPAEALAACKSLAAGASCTFTLPSRTVKGTCWAPDGKPLACRPSDAPAPK